MWVVIIIFFLFFIRKKPTNGVCPIANRRVAEHILCIHWNTNRLLKHSSTNKVEKGIPFSKCLLTVDTVCSDRTVVLRNGPFIPCMYSDTCPI